MHLFSINTRVFFYWITIFECRISWIKTKNEEHSRNISPNLKYILLLFYIPKHFFIVFNRILCKFYLNLRVSFSIRPSKILTVKNIIIYKFNVNSMNFVPKLDYNLKQSFISDPYQTQTQSQSQIRGSLARRPSYTLTN